MTGASTHRNRLAAESSAYLLQHAGNPVDWYPWGDEALELAKRLDRPILLSIGYSACHWCHVMERECFENPDIAAAMNERFVCIKVDREERPDVDHVYMKALQGMTGRGGWPMTMFLTPDARPFYAGTYFPPEDRGNMPGFPRVLLGVAKTYAEKRDEVATSAQRMVDYLAESRSSEGASAPLTEEALHEIAQSLLGSLDSEHGGFGRAPKFPGTMALGLLMETSPAGHDRQRDELVRLSLDRMAAGGIRDHLGGGFHRYSVDRIWLVPHFEKMLYDQALLAGLYIDAFRYFGVREYADVAEEILDYVVREMTSPDGGFYSAQDADSEGVEGKFFVWTRSEILEVLGSKRGSTFCDAYGVTEEGNFEERNILHRVRSAAELFRDEAHDHDAGCHDAGGHGASEAEIETELAVSRGALLARRGERTAPATDRKIVTDWNSLMISAMAMGAQVLGREDLLAAAMRAGTFLRTAMISRQGVLQDRLLHVHAAGTSRVPAFLDDYAFFGRACLDLFLARSGREWFDMARHCADRLLDDFLDEERGGFYFSGSSGEALVARTSDLHDGAVPAGNSVAADLLLRLWELTGEERYRQAGEGVLERFTGEVSRHPYSGALLLSLAARRHRGLKTVVIVGEPAASAQLARAARETFDPSCSVVAPGREAQEWFPSALQGKPAPESGALAYLCEGTSCSLPIADEESLRTALRSSLAGGV